RFYYSLPQSSRFEERSESGEVKGNYAYVAPEGNEFKFRYEAGKKGFQVESNALPTAPEDTDEVKKAKEEFFQAYEQALALAEIEESSEEDDDESSEEDDDESSEEDDESSEEDDESSEEDDDESSEESSEESDEDDDDDDEETDFQIRRVLNLPQRPTPYRRTSSSFEAPNYVYKSLNQVPGRRRVVRNHLSRARNTRPKTVRISRKAIS
ncbi:UNVERIFIED_CONTAM: hypothetical protein GTU68_011221, partial [Idotea baltica]|nr:hypothetical protein [Idotea baltica]